MSSWTAAGTSKECQGRLSQLGSNVTYSVNQNNKNKKEEDTKIVKLDGCRDLKKGCLGCPI